VFSDMCDSQTDMVKRKDQQPGSVQTRVFLRISAKNRPYHPSHYNHIIVCAIYISIIERGFSSFFHRAILI